MANGIEFEERHIVQENPTVQELEAWVARSGRPLRKFFNTSGQKYRQLELKDKLPAMAVPEQLALLAADGMLVKRPMLITEDTALTGFREKEWAVWNVS